jgi:eukaryotic-like serine/threonine-protein kinase
MIGRTIGHYEILDEIGRGGMGIVYRAKDTKLDRFVALKFLPSSTAIGENDRSRFIQEARAAAALNHPNICTIYDIQDIDGHQFIVMELIDGRNLSRAIHPGPVPAVEQSIAWAIQIGEALAEAHEKGIVHRDVKCENIMVTQKGQIKVMDFGLAKLKGSVRLTRTSSTVGTLGYMAPEQIQGGAADARSDIFSFGVVLYEMLTGMLPFRGEHEAAMMYSILNEEPTPVSTYWKDAPAELVHILNRSLEKDPAERYQSINDMLIELRRLKRDSTRVSRASLPAQPAPVRKEAQRTGFRFSRNIRIAAVALLVLIAGGIAFMRWGIPGGKSGSSVSRIAVLPFENMGTPDQDYFADGITEEITSRLAGISQLGVIARTSAMQYKKTSKTLSQIGNELGVDYVLQGTIRWGAANGAVNHVRVNPALVRVSDATEVWSQSFDADVSDVFKIQSEIAANVAGALGLTLVQGERASLETKPTEHSDAYDLYLRGLDYFHRSYEKQDFEIAIRMLQKATSLDSKYALAYATLSEAHSAMYWFHFDHSAERLASAKEAVDAALRLDPGLIDAHLAMGYYYYWGFLDYDHALQEFSVVEKNRPRDSHLLLAVGSVYRRQGKMELALNYMQKAAEYDPQSGELALNLGQTLRLLRRYPESERTLDRTITLRPDALVGYGDKAVLYKLWDNDSKRTWAVLNDALRIGGAGTDPELRYIRVTTALLDRKYEEALSLASSNEFTGYESQYLFAPKSYLLAKIYQGLNQPARARQYFDSTRVLLEEKISKEPLDARYHSLLGLVYAGIGKNEDAIREGKRGFELLPMSREAWRGSFRVFDLAQIDATTGHADEAVELLQQLLSQPTDFSASYIRRLPDFDALHGNKRFQQITESGS